MKKTLDTALLTTIMCDDAEDYTLIYDKMIDTTRWSEIHEMVFQDNSDSTYWKTKYSRGATEVQDEAPFEYHDGKVEQVIPVEKTIIEYSPVTN